MQQDEPRRYLIAIGSPDCSKLKLPSLPNVESDIEKIVKLFTHSQQGYQRQLDEIPLVTSVQIKDALRDWFSSKKRRASDCVIIYYAGHGYEREGFGDHYLLTVESHEDHLPSTAIETRSLVRSLFQGNNDYPRNVLLILDVCYAEIGQQQALNALSNLQNFSSTGGGVWLVASSIDTKAGDGAFVAALEKVMQIKHEEAVEFLTISTLMGLLNQHFKDTKQDQRARANSTGGTEETLFIRNPCFLRSQPETECTLEAKEASQVSAQLRIDPIAQAVARLSTDYEELNEAFFDRYRQNSGKSNLLKTKLATWSMILQGNYVERDQQNAALDTVLRLAALDGTSLLIIRGEPGAGKTALMRWLAYQLVQQGKRVFEKKTQGFDWLEQLRLFSEEMSGEHFYVLVDDLFRDEAILEGLEENELLFPFTLIGTTRRNEDQHDALDEHYEIRWLDLERPSNTEKERLLELALVRDSMQARSAQKKQELMAAPTMLVLMLQLSEGKTFEKVIADIIQRLPNTEECPIYEAFGIICSFFQHGIAVYPEILTLCLSNRKCSLPVIQAELEGLIEIAPFAGFEGFTTIHELIAKTAMTLPYERGRSSGNLSYSISNPTLLDRYLAVAIHCLDPTQKTHRRWAYSVLRKLAISGETRLVHQLLQDYQGEIQKLQQMGGFGDWSNWASFYRLLGLEQERLRCLNSMLQVEPQTSNEVGYCIMPLAKHVTGEQKHDLIKKVEKWLSDYPNAHHIREQHLLLVNAYCDIKQKQVAIAQTEQWLIDHPDDFLVRMRYLAIVESFGDVKQKQVVIAQTEQWLIDHPDNTSVRTKYLAIVESFGDVKQKQVVIAQTEQWLIDHPDNTYVRTKYLATVESFGDAKQKQAAIAQTEQWLIDHPDDTYVRTKYLAIVLSFGDAKQKQAAIAQTEQWLIDHPDDTYVRTKYLAIVLSFGDAKQKQVAIAQTEQWLIDHPDNTDVRTKYLAIVESFGDVKQRQSAITQTEQWLDNNIQQLKTSHKHITYETNVRKRRRHKSHRAEQSAISGTSVQMGYLALVQDHGTVEQKQGATARAVQWLYNHSNSPHYSQVETEYLYWIGRNKSSEDIQPIIKQLQVAIEQVLKKCRDEATLLIIFGNFRDYLDYETCHSISTKIIQFSLSIEKWQNLIHAANFFRDHAEIEKAEEIYRKILRSAKLNNGRSSADVQKTIDFASLSYAQLLLLKDPQESEAALKLLRPILAKNFKHALAHRLTARCYQSMDDSNRAIDSFKKAIRFDQHQKGTFYYQFGCFYLDTLSDEVNARECFENSLNQQINLPACIALAELEIKSQNYDRAQSLLNQALALEPTNRPEQEERDRFSQRIQTLQARLKELSG